MLYPRHQALYRLVLTFAVATALVSEGCSQVVNKATILGGIVQPASFAIEPGMRLRDAIAARGGFKVTADTSRIFLRRRERIEQLDGAQIMAGSGVQNVELQLGDVVYVPELSPASQGALVLGEVANSFVAIPNSTRSLRDVLSSAGITNSAGGQVYYAQAVLANLGTSSFGYWDRSRDEQVPVTPGTVLFVAPRTRSLFDGLGRIAGKIIEGILLKSLGQLDDSGATADCVAVIGEVVKPVMVPHVPGRTLREYIRAAEGITTYAAPYVYLDAPEFTLARKRSQLADIEAMVVPPGATIVVGRDVRPSGAVVIGMVQHPVVQGLPDSPARRLLEPGDAAPPVTLKSLIDRAEPMRGSASFAFVVSAALGDLKVDGIRIVQRRDYATTAAKAGDLIFIPKAISIRDSIWSRLEDQIRRASTTLLARLLHP